MNSFRVHDVSINEDRTEMTVRVTGNYSSGPRTVRYDRTLNEDDQIVAVRIYVDGPGPGDIGLCVMVNIDQTLTIKGNFADAVKVDRGFHRDYPGIH